MYPDYDAYRYKNESESERLEKQQGSLHFLRKLIDKKHELYWKPVQELLIRKFCKLYWPDAYRQIGDTIDGDLESNVLFFIRAELNKYMPLDTKPAPYDGYQDVLEINCLPQKARKEWERRVAKCRHGFQRVALILGVELYRENISYQEVVEYQRRPDTYDNKYYICQYEVLLGGYEFNYFGHIHV